MHILMLTFLGVLIPTYAMVAVAAGDSSTGKMVQQRLRRIHKDTLIRENDELELTKKQELGFKDRFGSYLRQFRFAGHLDLLIMHAGSSTSVGSIVLMSLSLAAGFGFAAHVFHLPLPVVALAVAIGGLSRYVALRLQKSRRLKKFNVALPDAIELMARALRAGHSTGSSIEMIAQQSVEPLAAEFETCFQQQKFGIPFRNALLEMGERIPSKDLHFLITAVLVQKETGGDLIDILDRTTRVIRERVRIEGEVRTYTAQGRMTGWILGLLPVIMLGLINIITPGYSDVLFHDPLGQKLLYAGGTLIIIGGLIIRKIVDIKV